MRIEPSTKTTQLGDLVAAAFDNAALVTENPGRQARLAAGHVSRLLGQSDDTRLVRLLQHARGTGAVGSSLQASR